MKRLKNEINLEKGFTPVELSIVIAIIGVIAALVQPGMREARKSENEAKANTNLKALYVAEKGVLQEKDRYSTDISKLGFSPDLKSRTGSVNGYTYELTSTDPLTNWQAVACPAVANRSGGLCFRVDQTGVITPLCPPGQKFDPVSGKCVSDETSLDALGLDAVKSVNDLSMGFALPMAQTFLTSPTLVQNILRKLDANGDGLLSFDELLNADILALARSVQPGLGGGGGGGGQPGGPDTALRVILRGYLDGLKMNLALGAGNETPPAAVSLVNLSGDPSGFLNQLAGGNCPPIAEGC